MGERKIYSQLSTWQEALESLLSAVRASRALADWPDEAVRSREASGRVLAEAVYASRSVPHYPSAAMDGYAVRSADTFEASEINPLRLKLGRDALAVDTGDAMPAGFDAVVMVEDAWVLDAAEGAFVEISSPAFPWQHVRLVGEDAVERDMLYPSGHLLRPVDAGMLLAAGITLVRVRKRPVVAILPTGDEMSPADGQVDPGRIPEFNSAVLAAMVKEWGGLPVGLAELGGDAGLAAVPDDERVLLTWVGKAVRSADVVVVNAGSSRGSGDLTSQVLGKLGQVLTHGIATRPSKPLIAAMVEGKPALGLPGYPVSAYLAAELFLKPLVLEFLGMAPSPRPAVEAKLTRRVISHPGVEEFVRVKLGRVKDRIVATPLPRGAGMVNSLARADGILTVPLMSEGVEEGAAVKVEMLGDLEGLKWAITVIGSHDPGIDVAADLLARLPVLRSSGGRRFSVSSAHVGSMGGMLAVRRGEALIAGVHLLDESTGTYNEPHVRKIVVDGKEVRSAALVRMAVRKQGLIVAKGNPKGIRGFEDLTRADVTFVNRQRGSGTRVLLDYVLAKLGLSSDAIRGYERQEYTHAAVAVAVSSGSADAGLGIMAAARALDLDFVPVADEPYDFLIADWAYEDERVQAFLRAVRHEEFRRALESMGGYDCSSTGEERWIR